MSEGSDDMMGLKDGSQEGQEDGSQEETAPSSEADTLGDNLFGTDRSKEAPKRVAPPSEMTSEPGVGSSSTRPSVKREASIPLGPADKVVRIMLRRAGIDFAPKLDELMRGKDGDKMAIKDIGIFIGPPKDDALKAVWDSCKLLNTVNLSAEVVKNQVIKVGSQILESGKMYQPIQVARVDETIQCTSGRHRLVFLAFIYGVDAEIPVYLEDMSINEARDAVVVANQGRPLKAMERADHAVLAAVGGNLDADQDELYSETAITKAKAKKYCVFSVLNRGYPENLSFKVSMTSSRKDGGVTTLTNVENFWGASLHWDKEVVRKDFDTALKASIDFINSVVMEMTGNESFEASHHLSSMSLAAIGKWYKEYASVTGKDGIDKAGEVASHIIAMGEIGRDKSDKTYRALAKLMSK